MVSESLVLTAHCYYRYLNGFVLALILVCVGLFVDCSRQPPEKPAGKLLIAFPKSGTELHLVFSEPVDRATAEQPGSYKTELGLQVLGASVDPSDLTRVTLKTGAMPTWMTDWTYDEKGRQTYAENIRVDSIRAVGVHTASGAALASDKSPRFVQGIPAVRTIQKPREEVFPFFSRLVGLVAAHEYNPDGGVPDKLIKDFGFMFLHRPSTEGPFNSIKIVTNKQVPGLAEAEADIRAGQRKGLHVLWAGGEIQNIEGETRLVDTGFMEGSLVDPPLQSPPPYPIKSAEISGEAAKSLRAKSLQGVICAFENVTIDSVSSPDAKGLRSFTFHDASGAKVSGVLMDTVSQKVRSGQKFPYMRGIVHQPGAGRYEVIVELDEHLGAK